MIGIYLVYGYFPGVEIKNDKVSLPRNIQVKLKDKSNSDIESVIRAFRVYLSSMVIDDILYQKNLDLCKLEKTGTPDKISLLLLDKRFQCYSMCKLSLSSIFYEYKSKDAMYNLITKSLNTHVLLCTLTFCSAHLFVIVNLESDMLTVIDVSKRELELRNISLDYLHTLLLL